MLTPVFVHTSHSRIVDYQMGSRQINRTNCPKGTPSVVLAPPTTSTIEVNYV